MKLTPGNAQHIGGRNQQQDAFGFSRLTDPAFCRHAGLVAVVADGMGGLAHGDAASKAALKAFLEAYEQKVEEESIPDALLRSLAAANEAVCVSAAELGSSDDMGTTLIAVAARDEQLHWISAGDSGIFLYRDRGLTQINEAHVFATELDDRVAQGLLDQQIALAHPEREALTSYLGLTAIPAVDRSLRSFTLLPGDRVLLASDGLFKTLTAQEMAGVIGRDPQKSSEALVSRTIAANRQYQDNVTAIVIAAEANRRGVPTTESKRGELAAGAAPKRRNRMAMVALLAVTLLVAAAMVWWQFFGPEPAGAKTNAVPPASDVDAQPVREGAANPSPPPIERQPGQAPAALAPDPKEEAPQMDPGSPPPSVREKTRIREKKKREDR